MNRAVKVGNNALNNNIPIEYKVMELCYDLSIIYILNGKTLISEPPYIYLGSFSFQSCSSIRVWSIICAPQPEFRRIFF